MVGLPAPAAGSVQRERRAAVDPRGHRRIAGVGLGGGDDLAAGQRHALAGRRRHDLEQRALDHGAVVARQRAARSFLV